MDSRQGLTWTDNSVAFQPRGQGEFLLVCADLMETAKSEVMVYTWCRRPFPTLTLPLALVTSQYSLGCPGLRYSEPIWVVCDLKEGASTIAPQMEDSKS